MKKLLFFIMGAFIALNVNADNFFVDAAKADNTGDGLSWETAKQTLPAAFTLAKTNNATSQNDNIYVKQGTYTNGTIDLTGVDCTGISLYGGFATASTGTDITLRDIALNATIIDGGGTVDAIKIAREVLVDGFTIQNGKNASYTVNGVSGGLAMNFATAVVSNCIIRNNTRTTANNKGTGGGVFLGNGTIRDCEIYGNSTTHANSQGAIQITGGTIERCKIYNNTAGSVGQVGGILVAKASATINVYAALDANITLANNVIYNNAYQGIKVGLVSGETKTVSIINNTIVNNGSPAIFGGAGITQLTATNNIIYNNAGNETLDGTYTYNAIQAASVSGTGNIALASDNQANLFTAPTATIGIIADPSSNWMPVSGSGLFNVGDNSAAVGTVDIAGSARIQQATIDLGAYETSLSTAVENIKSNKSTVYSKQGGVIIENATAYEIYTMDGHMQKNGKIENNFVPMANGIYLVKTLLGNKHEITKVIVR